MGLIQPPPDAIQEIKVITSGVNAEFGRGSAIISTVTRSGTNEFHGSLWDYFRNDVFDARSFFSTAVPKLRYNQFGGTLGGPIRHNKAFFFVSYQGLESRADIVRSSAFPPTADERRGDFSRTRGTPPRDPLTGMPFPNGIIPSSRLDPVAQKLAAKFPLPNRANGTYVTQVSVPTSDWMVLGRVDYDFTPSDRTSFRYFIDNPATDTTFKAWQPGGALNHFAMQFSETDDAAHAGAIEALRKAAGRYQIIYSESTAMRTDVDGMRRHAWSVAMAGMMPMMLEMDIASTPVESLQQCRYLQRFFEATDFYTMTSHDELKHGETKYVLADAGRSYIAYADKPASKLGIKGLPAGRYAVTWLDCRTGETASVEAKVGQPGDHTFDKPQRIGAESAAWIRRAAGKIGLADDPLQGQTKGKQAKPASKE